jgi:hypothetical protein
MSGTQKPHYAQQSGLADDLAFVLRQRIGVGGDKEVLDLGHRHDQSSLDADASFTAYLPYR